MTSDPRTADLPSALDPTVVEIAGAVRDAGGRAVLVGGWVRDHFLGVESKDIDIEVFGLGVERLEALLGRFGSVHEVGRAFGVFRVRGIDIDFSLPRHDSKRGPGHRGFDVAPDPSLDFARAARRRDLTINSIGLDPLTGEVLDPYAGCRDLERRVLRATDPAHFREDPLRGLRVVQLAARLEMLPDEELGALCRTLDLGELSGERIFDEIRKLLLRATRPSIGFRVLADTGLLRFFPELDALRGVAQDPEWHPEGDVWTHTLMVVDAAAALRGATAAGEATEATEAGGVRRAGDTTADGGEGLALMLGALCHDLGKPVVSERIGGRVRSHGHEAEGAALTRALLGRMRVPAALTDKVAALVEHHLAPTRFVRNGASAKGYRRLAHRLERAGVSIELLARLARADHLGRATDDAIAGRFDAGDTFLAAARTLCVERTAPRDAVLGRHLIARGMRPGPGFAPLLERCREVQDETGWTDPERILDRVLHDRGAEETVSCRGGSAPDVPGSLGRVRAGG